MGLWGVLIKMEKETKEIIRLLFLLVMLITIFYLLFVIPNKEYAKRLDSFCNTNSMEHKVVDIESYCYDTKESKLYKIVIMKYETYWLGSVPKELKLAKEVVTLE